jgi:hypothetical protein
LIPPSLLDNRSRALGPLYINVAKNPERAWHFVTVFQSYKDVAETLQLPVPATKYTSNFRHVINIR